MVTMECLIYAKLASLSHRDYGPNWQTVNLRQHPSIANFGILKLWENISRRNRMKKEVCISKEKN